MGEAQGWDRRRYVTLVVVLGLHAALLIALLLLPPARWLAGSTPRALELLYLTPAPPSKIRAENLRPHRIGSDTLISIAPPTVGSLSMAPSTSGSDGSGTGVDWRAEARRALQAFEIRNNKRTNGPVPSQSSAEGGWWPRAQHHGGEQYKTDTGDWIVWIDSNCYQIARAASSYAQGAVLPQTICRDKEARPPRDLREPPPSIKSAPPAG